MSSLPICLLYVRRLVHDPPQLKINMLKKNMLKKWTDSDTYPELTKGNLPL